MSTAMWIVIGVLVLAGTVLCSVFAAMRYWVAFFLFLAVFIIGVVAASVQAVLTT